jgi:hypothetical protein
MDYLGMAQDLRRMKRNFYKNLNWKNTFRFILNWEETDFLDELCEFEEYCINEAEKGFYELG